MNRSPDSGHLSGLTTHLGQIPSNSRRFLLHTLNRITSHTWFDKCTTLWQSLDSLHIQGELRRENVRRASEKLKSDVGFTANWQVKVGLYIESVLCDIHGSILVDQMIFADICRKPYRSF